MVLVLPGTSREEQLKWLPSVCVRVVAPHEAGCEDVMLAVSSEVSGALMLGLVSAAQISACL